MLSIKKEEETLDIADGAFAAYKLREQEEIYMQWEQIKEEEQALLLREKEIIKDALLRMHKILEDARRSLENTKRSLNLPIE